MPVLLRIERPMSTLIEFLRQQKNPSSDAIRTKHRKEWLDALDSFFVQVRAWLVEAEEKNLIRIHAGKIKITEETLGTYSVPYVEVKIGTKAIRLRPIGATIIGADGRVDMETPKGKYLLLYLADRNQWVHGFGKQPERFPVLTEELFTELIKRALT